MDIEDNVMDFEFCLEGDVSVAVHDAAEYLKTCTPGALIYIVKCTSWPKVQKEDVLLVSVASNLKIFNKSLDILLDLSDETLNTLLSGGFFSSDEELTVVMRRQYFFDLREVLDEIEEMEDVTLKVFLDMLDSPEGEEKGEKKTVDYLLNRFTAVHNAVCEAISIMTSLMEHVSLSSEEQDQLFDVLEKALDDFIAREEEEEDDDVRG